MQKVFDEIFKPDSEPTAEQIWTASTVIAILVVSFLAMFLVIPMLWAIYSAKELSTFANYTRAGNATFKLNATAGSLISLVIVNLLILIFTLGIGRPFMQQRLIRYMCDRIEVIGTSMWTGSRNPSRRWTEREKAWPMRLISVSSDGD